MKLIVGLGNPGKEYEHTRHNIGFDIVDEFANKNGFDSFKQRFQGLVSENIVQGEKIILLKPLTYMNLSGNSIVQIVNFYKLNIEKDVIVVYDDMDLPLGKVRIREKGSSGGHNGIKSIIAHLGQMFIRVKCGIGKPKIANENINFVLGRFTKEENNTLINSFENIINLLNDILKGNEINTLMQKYNKK